MQTTRYRIKMFEEHRVVRKDPGAAPGTWITISKTTPIDEAINCWLQETGSILVSCSPPGFHIQWLDKEMTVRAVILSVMVTYIEMSNERTVSVPEPVPEPVPESVCRDGRQSSCGEANLAQSPVGSEGSGGFAPFDINDPGR